ncbi:hypothetical protein Pla123a_07760 [Posidoniimonas polymericola]|uniref:PEP-CTERM protein-sorting domain-containing protein n=1 Tax=Posidoniimonas polymericola TaxID=2528002 RepID=A0A5C5ZFJ5_9BACT|nr:hypothetical protein [Posidoniimonas polymericola]TWT85968.1 hypothetical protein Pla123a_07760 [Posidoniimonas polymericola]
MRCLFTLLLAAVASVAGAQSNFTTVIDLPADLVELTADIGPGTQVNVHAGGQTAAGTSGDRLEVGSAMGGAASELNVLGGAVGAFTKLYGNATLNAHSGVVGDDLLAEAGSQVNLHGGQVGERFTASGAEVLIDGAAVGFDASFNDGAAVTMHSGSIDSSMQLLGSRFDLHGGQIGGGAEARSHSEMNIYGGTVLGRLDVYQESSITIHDGDINQLFVVSGSKIALQGGVVQDRIQAWGGTVDITGGHTQVIDIVQGGIVNLSGGGVDYLNVFGQSTSGAANTLRLFGGDLPEQNVAVHDNAAIAFFGTGFALDGVAIEGLAYGQTTTISQRDVALAGELADGSAFSYQLNSIFDDQTGLWFSPGAAVTVTTILAGDFNADGQVDAADYSVWRDNLGAAVTLPGDVTPGSISELDYEVWRNNLGAVFAGFGVAGVHPTPEPHLLTLAALGAGMLTMTRRPREDNLLNRCS